MLVTVAICTWNRADLLDRTLQEMRKLEIPPGVGWELLVVNNNCTDHTDDVLRRHAERLPIRCLSEEKQGLSHARNCAAAAARGELVLWTDDDVLVHPQWLAEYVRAADAWPDASFFGGPIAPYFRNRPPDWLNEVFSEIAAIFAIRDLGDEPIPIDLDHLPYGANYALRTTVQREYLYDPTIGRKADALMSGEEYAVIQRMLADGLQGRYVPTARVRHLIPEDRQTITYVRRYYFFQGRFQAMQDRDRSEHRDLRTRFWFLRQAIKQETQFRLRRPLGRPAAWVKHLRQSSYYWGRLLG